MIIDGIHIPVTRQWVGDVLEKRVKEQGIKIEDLFIITRCISRATEGDTMLETEYGKIRIFFREDLPPGRLALICHRSKFDYPKKNVGLSYNLSPQGTVVRREEEYVN
jgi:hypothetical protein